MAKSSTMETLIMLATDEVDKAAVMLGKMIKIGTEAKQKLDLLTQYREEYENRFDENRKAGLSAMDYRNYRNFIEKLDYTIRTQQEVLRNADKHIEDARAVWKECEKKRVSYETLQKRADEAELKKESRREQRDTDELNSRKARMNMSKPK